MFQVYKGRRAFEDIAEQIRQAILRVITNQSPMIRLPVHLAEAINKLKRTQRSISTKQGREAKLKDIAQEMEISCRKNIPALCRTWGTQKWNRPKRNPRESRAPMNPWKKPSMRKGPLINQLVAPIRRITDNSSRRA